MVGGRAAAADILGEIDTTLNGLCACGCGVLLGPGDRSGWWASEDCQKLWQTMQGRRRRVRGAAYVAAWMDDPAWTWLGEASEVTFDAALVDEYEELPPDDVGMMVRSELEQLRRAARRFLGELARVLRPLLDALRQLAETLAQLLPVPQRGCGPRTPRLRQMAVRPPPQRVRARSAARTRLRQPQRR